MRETKLDLTEALEWADQVKTLSSQLSHVTDHEAIDALRTVSVLTGSFDLVKVTEDLLRIAAYRLLTDCRETFDASSPELRQGDIRLGMLAQGDSLVGEFRLQPRDLTRHFAIFGQTGSGKTTLAYNLMSSLLSLKIPFLFIDTKRDGRALLRRHPELVVVPWRHLPSNWLKPPEGMEVKSWWQLFAEICGHVWGVYHAGTNYLLEFLDELYPQYEQTGKLPTLYDLYLLMKDREESTKKRLEYYDVMWNRIRTLISVFGKRLAVRDGFPLESLLQRSTVLELDQLRLDEQDWLTALIPTFLWAHALVNNLRGEQLRYVIIVDEAQRVWSSDKEWRETTREMGSHPLALFPTQLRDFGIGLVFITQEPSKLMDSVHANTLVKIVGNLGSGKDIYAVSEAMALDEDETKAITKLQRGEWVVKMSDRYTKPFMIVTEPYPVDKDVSDAEVLERLKDILPKQAEDAEEPGNRADSKPASDLSSDGWVLLEDINAHPFRSIATRYEAVRFSVRRGDASKDELLRQGLVKEVSVQLGKTRPSKFLVLTDAAIQLLEHRGHDTRLWRHTGHQGFEHQLYVVLIAYSLRNQGWQAFIEKQVNTDRRVDILVQNSQRRVAIEVELTSFDLMHELTVLSYVDEMVLLVKGTDLLSYASAKHAELPFDIRSRVKLYAVTDYLHFLLKGSANDHGNNFSDRQQPDSRPAHRNNPQNRGNQPT